MRNTLLMSAAVLAVLAGPALAQPATPGGSTAAMPGTTGPGSTGMTPGLAPAPDAPASPGMTGMRPMRNQQQHRAAARTAPMAQPMPASTRRTRGGSAPASVAQDGGVAVPPTSDYRGGAGSPSSTAASNTTAANTRSEIAPRLPNPDANGNSPQAYLAAAQRAMAANRTGAAQEALERAETRLLTRSTDPSMGNMPDPSGAVQAIGDARRALSGRDPAAARAAVSRAMSSVGG